MAPTKPKATAAKATPAKQDLKEGVKDLRIFTSLLASFTSRWEDLEDHLSSIDRFIEDRLRMLESGDQDLPVAASPVATPQLSEKDKTAAAEPRAELKSLCVNMDGRALLTYINDNRQDLTSIYDELNQAIQAAPDPAALVLDAMDEFYPSKRWREDTFDGGLHANRRSCIYLLERLHMISPEIKPAVRDRAKKLAAEWKVKMVPDAGRNLETVAFLQLLVSYGIASDFEEDYLLDLLVFISKKKEAISLCRDLGLHGKMGDLVQKLSGKGKHLDAIKFIYACGLVEKFPPVPLLKAYVKESKRIADEMRQRGSAKSKNAAISRQIDQFGAVIKAIEEYKLESEYSSEILRKRVAQLAQWKAQKGHLAGNVAVKNSKAQYQQWQANKQPHPSTATATAMLAAQPLPPLSQTQPQFSLSQTQPQFSLDIGAPNMGSTWSCDLSGSIHPYNQTASIYKGNLDLGPMQSTLGSYLYSDPYSRSGLYDRPGAYGSYSSSSGLVPKYNSPLYP